MIYKIEGESGEGHYLELKRVTDEKIELIAKDETGRILPGGRIISFTNGKNPRPCNFAHPTLTIKADDEIKKIEQ